MHHRQRRHLFRDEQHCLAVMRCGGNQVCDGLRFASSGRPLHNKAGPAPDLFDHLGLGGVGVDHLNDFGRVKQRIQSVLRAKDRWLMCETFGQQPAHQLILRHATFGPCLRIKISVHQQFGERKEPQLHSIGVNRPTRLGCNHFSDLRKIVGWGPFLSFADIRQDQAEILLEALLKRQVGRKVIVAAADIIS